MAPQHDTVPAIAGPCLADFERGSTSAGLLINEFGGRKRAAANAEQAVWLVGRIIPIGIVDRKILTGIGRAGKLIDEHIVGIEPISPIQNDRLIQQHQRVNLAIECIGLIGDRREWSARCARSGLLLHGQIFSIG